MLGNAGWSETTADEYLPYLGHARPDALLLSDERIMAAGELPGLPFELSDDTERNTMARMLNGLLKNIADDNVTICSNLVRYQRVDDLPHVNFPNAFSAELDRLYRQRILAGRLYQNTWFLSVIVAPRNTIGGAAGSRLYRNAMAKMQKRQPTASEQLLSQLDDIWGAIARTLSGYGLRRLGLRPSSNGHFHFSEIAEALRLILTGEYLPVPLVSGPIGNAIYTDQVIFGRRAYEVRAPGASRFGAIYGLREYPAETHPGMLDGVLSLPFPLVLSQSFSFLAKHDAVGKLNLKQNQMRAAGDQALSQIEGLTDAQDQLSSGFLAMGSHHLSLAVYADTLADLNLRAGTARTALADAGAVAVQETIGNQAAYFAQLPGNSAWRTRPGAITTRNFAALSGFDAYPRGATRGLWGQALARFRTTAATYYDYIPHVGDVGMTGIFGKIGQGKTTFMLFLLDEAARLGPMKIIETARDCARKYRITLMLYYQSVGQLRDLFGEQGPSKWFESVSWFGFAGVKTKQLAEELAATIGEYGVLAWSEGENTGTSGKGLEAGHRSKGNTLTYHELKRQLIRAEEIMHDMRDDEQIIIPKSGRPLRCGRAIYFRRPEMVSRVAQNRFANKPKVPA